MRCRYNAVNFLQNPNNKHFLPLLSQCHMQDCDKLHRVITSLDCIYIYIERERARERERERKREREKTSAIHRNLTVQPIKIPFAKREEGICRNTYPSSRILSHASVSQHNILASDPLTAVPMQRDQIIIRSYSQNEKVILIYKHICVNLTNKFKKILLVIGLWVYNQPTISHIYKFLLITIDFKTDFS